MDFVSYPYLILQINSQTLQITVVHEIFLELNGLSDYTMQRLFKRPLESSLSSLGERYPVFFPHFHSFLFNIRVF